MNDVDRASRITALQAIYGRRAVRSYEPQDVDRETIRKLIDAAVQAPSAMNAQPWAFSVVQDKERLKRYSDRAKVLLGRSTTDPKTQRYAALFADASFNIFYDAHTLIVICGPSHGPYVEADCWLAAENLMLAAYAIGLGTCCIGFAQRVLDEADVRTELGIPSEMKAYAPIIVGVPMAAPPAVPRSAPRILSWH